MATSPQLQSLIAETFNVPIATVFHHDRNLVDAGIRMTKGPGRGGLPQTARDAANLLLVVAASSMVKDTVKVHRHYSKLPAPERYTNHIAGMPPELAALSSKHSFIDMLTALVESAVSGSLLQHLTRHHGSVHTVHDHALRVIFISPNPRADIHIPGLPEVWHKFIYCDHPPKTQDLNEIMAWSAKLTKKYGPAGDLQQVRQFTALTLFKVGDLLRAK